MQEPRRFFARFGDFFRNRRVSALAWFRKTLFFPLFAVLRPLLKTRLLLAATSSAPIIITLDRWSGDEAGYVVREFW